MALENVDRPVRAVSCAFQSHSLTVLPLVPAYFCVMSAVGDNYVAGTVCNSSYTWGWPTAGLLVGTLAVYSLTGILYTTQVRSY